MKKLNIFFENCYGISSLKETFDFSSGKSKSYAIYAPNGLMKTSFSKTFYALSKGEQPKEERFNRESICKVDFDGADIENSHIYVLKSEIEITSDSEAVTNILVNKESKDRYDSLSFNIIKAKLTLEGTLQKKSKVKKTDIEVTLVKDFGADDFVSAIRLAKEIELDTEGLLDKFIYGDIFDPKAIAVLNSPEFLSKSREFNLRYQEVFDQAGSIYTRGVFNPVKADSSFSALHKNGYFLSGHKVHLKGEEFSIDYEELQEKIKILHESIDNDAVLKTLRTSVAKNAQSQELIHLLENLSATEIEFFLSNITPELQADFKKKLWAFYIQNTSDSDSFLNAFNVAQDELKKIEEDAAVEAPSWTEAVSLFNSRFVDMPFTLSLFNHSEAALGKDKAKLKFTFKDGADQISFAKDEIKSLSQGEKRALYLLNFIFEVEDRRRKKIPTLFVVDDVADSFDYKNKHAIIRYLEDVTKVDCFYQIILTHNFDFFRALANSFVPYKNCLMANRSADGINLSKAEGVKNYFIGKWKENIANCDFILCASVPFTRNLIEYTKGDKDKDYLVLTSLLHWKSDSEEITVGQYYDVYNKLFGKNHPIENDRSFIGVLFEKADEIKLKNNHDGLNLEDKVLLCIAIRIRAEIFLIEEIRKIKNDDSYWCNSNNQFGALMKEYEELAPNSIAIKTLEKVSVTVSSNIHLNSFMYEPILDLTIEHLIDLYIEILDLKSGIQAS